MDLEAQNAPTNDVPAQGASQEAAPAQAEVTDIDGFSEFKFQGKSYTPENLARIFKDYESKSQVAERAASYEQFLDNITIDIEAVLQDPKLASRFYETYPERFHPFLKRELDRQGSQAASQQQSTQGVPKEVLSKLSTLEGKLTHYERMAHEAEVATQEAVLQKTVEPLFAKYDFANEDAVYAKAQALLEQGYRMTSASWERLIKESHDAIQKRVEAKHQAKLKEQLEKGKQAQDTGAGGSAPGQAPQKARTIAEATEHLLAKLAR